MLVLVLPPPLLQLQQHPRCASDKIRLSPRSRAIHTTHTARAPVACLRAAPMVQARSLGLGRLEACQRLPSSSEIENSAA